MSNMYDILGKLKNLLPGQDKPAEVASEPVYESVEAKGDIMEAVKSLEEKYMGFKAVEKAAKEGGAKDPEAVAASIGRKKYGKKKFQKAAAAGKKLGEETVEESGGPYELYNPKHPKFAANYKKFKAKNPDAKLQDFIDAMKKKEHGVNEGEYDPAPIDPEAVAKRKRLQALKDKAEDEGDIFAKEKNTPIRKVAGKAYGGAAQHDAPEADDLDEVAPPGAKAERMVKHIKKGYAKDGKLTKREKGIAYATAWKAHNKGQVEEGTKFGDTIKNSEAKMTKAKKVKVTESRMLQEGDYFYEKIAKALAEKNPTLNTASPDFVTAVRQEMVAHGIEPNRARNIIMIDDDFISDVATSYGHYCQEIAECGAPINSHLGGSMEELDEIARLAGIQREGNAFTGKLAQTSQGDEFELDGKTYKDTSSLGEAEMDEGNEYTKARLDAIQAGKDVFTVGGKVHKVSGDTSQERVQVEETISVNVTANADEADGIHILQLLAGLQANADAQPEAQPAQAEPQPLGQPVDLSVEQPVDVQPALEEEGRDIEYSNTPNEKIAPLSAATPSGTDLNRSKRQDPRTANRAANPLAKDLEESLWKKYEDLISDIKE